MMTPDDDFYTAPFCFMPKNRKGGFIVFTAQVVWLHGNPLGESERAHHKAHEYMELKGKYDPPHLGTVEKFMTTLSLKEQDIFTFTSDGCYPTKQDISQALGKWKWKLMLYFLKKRCKQNHHSFFCLSPNNVRLNFKQKTKQWR